ncbi:MAG TPA: barstar family protein [Verrucomicrobiae bacterium]|nr:barstar family protein [Verrucomicrobiae bacterium]
MLEQIDSLSKLFTEIKPAVYAIKEIKHREIEHLKKDSSIAIFNIDGSKIINLNSFFKNFANDLNFPYTCTNLDSFYDWLIDLSWFKEEKFIIIFSHHENLKTNDKYTFAKITEIFRYKISCIIRINSYMTSYSSFPCPFFDFV